MKSGAALHTARSSQSRSVYSLSETPFAALTHHFIAEEEAAGVATAEMWTLIT